MKGRGIVPHRTFYWRKHKENNRLSPRKWYFAELLNPTSDSKDYCFILTTMIEIWAKHDAREYGVVELMKPIINNFFGVGAALLLTIFAIIFAWSVILYSYIVNWCSEFWLIWLPSYSGSLTSLKNYDDLIILKNYDDLIRKEVSFPYSFDFKTERLMVE